MRHLRVVNGRRDQRYLRVGWLTGVRRMLLLMLLLLLVVVVMHDRIKLLVLKRRAEIHHCGAKTLRVLLHIASGRCLPWPMRVEGVILYGIVRHPSPTCEGKKAKIKRERARQVTIGLASCEGITKTEHARFSHWLSQSPRAKKALIKHSLKSQKHFLSAAQGQRVSS